MISSIHNQLVQLFSNNHFKEVFKGGIVTFGVKILTLFIGFFTTWFISKWYGAGILGQFTLLNSIVGMATIFTVMGMNNSLVRLVPEHMVKYSFYSAALIYKKSIILVTAVSLSVAIIYTLFFVNTMELIFDQSGFGWLFIMVGPLIFFRSIFSMNISLLQALKKIRLMAFFQIIQPVMFTIFILLGTYVFYDNRLPIYSQVTVDIMLLIISVVIALGLIKKEGREKNFCKLGSRELLSLSLPMMITGVFTSIVFQTDTIMIGIMQTDVDVGIYNVAMKLASLASFVLMAVNIFAAPKYSELYHQGKIDDLKFVAQGFSRLLLVITLFIALFMILFGKYILSFFGKEFIDGYLALIFILVGWIFNAWAGPVVAMMNMINLHKEIQNIYIAVAIVNVLLNGVLIPIIGITGAAMASMLSGIIISFLSVIIVFKKEHFFILYIPQSIKNLKVKK